MCPTIYISSGFHITSSKTQVALLLFYSEAKKILSGANGQKSFQEPSEVSFELFFYGPGKQGRT